MNETINKSSIGEKQYLTFLMGQDQYSLDIMIVKEIIAYSSIMKVPMLPEYIKGVINLRNKVVPVIDLSMRFGKGKTEISKLTCIIIVELQKSDKKVEIGIIVDAVSEVISLATDEIEQTPEFGDDVHAEFISGMGRINERFIIMLNVSKVLNVQDLTFLEKAAKEGSNLFSGKPSNS
jgi:purine-binding chemotaxis protein CheW